MGPQKKLPVPVSAYLISQNGTDGLQRAVLQEEKEKNVVPIMESVLGGLESRGEAWECVNELEPGLALHGQAVPLHPLALRLARRWGVGCV